MQVTASDPASVSSKPSTTNARVSAARQRLKISPATARQRGVVVGRADRGRDHRTSGVEVTVGQGALPELDEVANQGNSALANGFVDDRR